jgi:hypothetical protein
MDCLLRRSTIFITAHVLVLCICYIKQDEWRFNLSLSQDIFKQATEDRLTSAKELPYFEGDFWPNVLEESIKELEQEEEERKREENSTSNESVDVSGIGIYYKVHCCVFLWVF